MVEEMLMDTTKQGYSVEEIKESIVKILQPYFTHEDVLNKYACNSQLLSASNFFVRYQNDDFFAQGVKLVIDCYKNANISCNKDSWNIILSAYRVMVEDENKMWSIRKGRVNLQEADLYEKMVQIFQQIGNVLEVSVKHILQELYALIYLNDKGHVDYEKIRKQDFGVVINNILDKNILQSILIVEPCGMKLSDWRNIAYHHTYSLDDGYIICTYGKDNANKIKMSMQELECYLHKIIRSSNVLNIARCIFVYDFIDEIPKKLPPLEKGILRLEIKCEQFRIELLSKGFKLGEVVIDENKVELDVHDLCVKIDQESKLEYCTEILFNAWNLWKRKFIYINYFSNTGIKICCLYGNVEACESISIGKKLHI